MSTQQAQLVEAEPLTDYFEYDFSGNEVTVQNKRLFLRHYIDCHTIYVAARRTGINKLTFYRWKDSDPVFAEAFADTEQSSTDDLETCLFERAKEKSDLLGIFMLKKYRPEFRDRVAVDLNVVHSEIEAMLSQVQETRQLPPATTAYVDSGNDSQATPVPTPSTCNSAPSPSK